MPPTVGVPSGGCCRIRVAWWFLVWLRNRLGVLDSTVGLGVLGWDTGCLRTYAWGHLFGGVGFGRLCSLLPGFWRVALPVTEDTGVR